MELRHTVFTCTEGLSVNRRRTDSCAAWGTNELHGIMMWGRSLFRWDIRHSTVYGAGDDTHGVGAYLGNHEFPSHQRYKSH